MTHLSDRRYREFIILVIMSALVQTNAYLLIPNFEFILEEFNINNALVGMMSGLYIVILGTSTLVWGILTDKLEKRKRLLRTNLFFALLCSLLSFMLIDFTPFLFAQLLLAFFIGSIPPITYSFITDLFKPGERITTLNVWNIISSVGSGIGFVIGLIAGFFGEWRMGIIGGTIAISLALLLSVIVHEPERGLSDIMVNYISMREKVFYPYRLSFSDIRHALTGNKTNIYMIMQSILVYFAWGAFSTWSIHALIEQANVNNVAAAIILGIASAGNLGSLVIAPIIDRLRRGNHHQAITQIVSISLIIETIMLSFMLLLIPKLNINSGDLISTFFSTISILYTNQQLQLTIILGVIGLMANSVVSPVRDSIIADINLPENRAVMISIIMISIFFGRGIGIMFVGYISSYVGSLTISIIISQLILIPAAIIWMKSSNTYSIDLNYLLEIMDERRLNIIDSMSK